MDIKTHIVQSPQWGEVKTKLGTPAIRVGEIQYTKHKIPHTSFYYGYAPKVNPAKIDFKALKKSAEENNCIVINFDCPNVTKDNPEASKLDETLKKSCNKSPKQTFSKFNVLLDISKSELELLSSFHHKTRYNIKQAEKAGVTVREGKAEDIKIFNELQNITAKRQKFYIHPDKYYETAWEILRNAGIAKMLIAEYEGKPLSCWMLFIYEGVLYYPYGASSNEHQNLFPNNLIAWEAIKLGQKMGCKTFDMWGAAKNPEDKADPWHGFTRFKLGYGGRHVEYIDSYDLVLNPAAYNVFNLANNLRWTLLRTIKR